MEYSSVSNNEQSFRDLNSLEQDDSLEVRFHFRQDVIVTEQFNLSKNLVGVWSYFMCCPEAVVNCEDEILSLNSSEYPFKSPDKDERGFKDEVSHGWLQRVLDESLLAPQLSLLEQNTGIVNYKSNHSDYSNLDECKTRVFENQSERVAVRIKLHGQWIGRSELILKLLINSTGTMELCYRSVIITIIIIIIIILII